MTDFAKGSNASWLLNTPIGDCNTQCALKSASIDELNAVLAAFPNKATKQK